MTVRVALDLMGGDQAPGAVLDGALLVDGAGSGIQVVLVGPVRLAHELLAERGAAGRLPVVAADDVVRMDEDPVRAVRARRDATVRVACRLVREGRADAVVSVGSTGAALAAGLFTLGRLPGMTRPALAAVVPARSGPLVLLDVGATVEASPALLVQFALCGAALARTSLGIPAPRVGLLNVGAEAGKGDPLRKQAFHALAALPLDFVGNIEGGDVPLGGRADVVVCDGFTGNVLLKGLEGAATLLGGALLEVLTSTPARRAVAAELPDAVRAATSAYLPETLGGAVLLGVDGVVVVGHGASTPGAVAGCVTVAAQAVRQGLVPAVREALAALGALSVSRS